MESFFKAPELCTLACLACVATGLLSFKTSQDDTVPRKRREFFYMWAGRFFIGSGLFVALGVVCVCVELIKEFF